MSEQADIRVDEAALLESLREDLPSARARQRMRQRLAAAGVLAAGTLSSASAAAASGKGLAGAPAGLVQKVASLSWSGKVVLAATVCAAASAPLAGHLLTTPPAHVAQVARVERARAPRRAVQPESQLPAAEPAPVAAAVEVAPASSGAAVEPITEARATTDLPPERAAPQRAAASANELPALRDTDARPKQTTRAVRGRALPADDSPAPPLPAAPASATTAADSPAQAPVPTASDSARSPAPPRPQPTAADELSAVEPAPRRSELNVFAVEPPRSRRAPLPPPPSTLAEETKLLERALAALQVRDLAAARAWLSLHAARFRDGLLRRERENVWKRVTALGDGASH